MLALRCPQCRQLAQRTLRRYSTVADASSSLARPAKKRRQHLFLAGLNPFLPSSSRNASCPSFTQVPLSEWLASVGLDDASCRDPHITHLSSGHNHTMIGFRDSKGTESIFAIGRNESGQLGIGYNSQEPTRGLVENFAGDYIESIRCGIASSYIQVRQGDDSVLYASGSQSRGRLGIPPVPDSHGRPSQAFISRATQVYSAGSRVSQVAAGFEHALVLTKEGSLLATGINTDGQLGMGDDTDRHAFSIIQMPEQLEEEGVTSIYAGADTSAVISKEGDLWSFGNSTFHGEKLDRVLIPKVMDWALIGLPKVTQFATGGSFSLLRNGEGLVYAAGFGAISQGHEELQAIRPKRITGLEGITSIAAGYGYAAAVNDRNELFVFGLNNEHGRLGIGTTTNLHRPSKVELHGYKICSIALCNDAAFVLVESLDD